MIPAEHYRLHCTSLSSKLVPQAGGLSGEGNKVTATHITTTLLPTGHERRCAWLSDCAMIARKPEVTNTATTVAWHECTSRRNLASGLVRTLCKSESKQGRVYVRIR